MTNTNFADFRGRPFSTISQQQNKRIRACVLRVFVSAMLTVSALLFVPCELHVDISCDSLYDTCSECLQLRDVERTCFDRTSTFFTQIRTRHEGGKWNKGS